MGIEIIVDENQKGQTAEQEPSDIEELGLEDDSNNQTEEEQTDDQQESIEAQGEDEDSVLPERFKGKTRTDIAKSYSELEKLLGRQSTELGELRKLAEQYINKAVGETEEQSQIDPEDLWADPNKVIDKRVESKVKSFEEKLSKFEQESAKRELKRLHPDVNDIIPSAEFQNWVVGDPVRVEQFRQANEKFDIDAANELLTEWKGKQEQAKSIQKEKRDKELKAAATETSSTGQSSKKIYRRTDLQRLRNSDPDKFEALQPEIIRAYAEGRVR